MLIRRRVGIAWIPASFGFLIAGCRALTVWEGGESSQSLKGIPFYSKTAAYEQTTSHVHQWQRVTLTAAYIHEENGKLLRRDMPTVQVYDVPPANREDLLAIQEEVSAFDGRQEGDPMAKVREIAKRLRGISFVPETLSLGTGRLASNTVKQVVVTDYSRKLYLNSGTSWPGSSKLAAELSADGTLTKADASIESKPGELATAISTLFPATTAFTALLKLNEKAAPATLSIKAPVELRMELATVGFADDHFRVVRNMSQETFPPLTGSEKGVSVMRRSLPGGAKDEKKADTPKVSFEGAITLPTAKEKKPE